MKASVRKQAQEWLDKLPNNEAVEKLREEFQRKGFLSKRELKILQSLVDDASKAA